jgi:two-component system sensor histidine kinase KdpD
MLMAGIQSGEVALELERRPVKDVVDAALRSLGAVLAKHKVEVGIPADLPPVPMDAGLMQRVFVSLAGNVAKHTPVGTHLSIAARQVDNDVEVVFEDDGPGLPKGREEEVFDSFARGEKQATRRGAGLGLAISRAIVSAHGGSIHAETPESGKGTRMVIRLPLRR